MTRVIITGGTGLIGRRLVRYLARQGYEVIVLTRNAGRHANAAPQLPGLRFVQWDSLTPQGWGHLIDAESVIINLAGENVANWRWTLTHKRIVLRSRVDATRAVVQAIAEAPHKPKALLQASAVGYYGDRGQMAIGEITTAGEGWRAEVCKIWEAESAPVESYGVRRALLRIGVVLERGGGALPALALGARFMAGRLGDGEQWVPWVHNADVTGALHHILRDEAISGAVNIVAPYPATNRDLLRAIGAAWRWPTFIPVPAFALRVALGEMASTVLDSQRIYPPLLLESGYQFLFPQASDAARDLLQSR